MRGMALFLALFVILLAVVMGGDDFFLNAPSLLLFLVVTLGLSTAVQGGIATWKALAAIRLLMVDGPPPPDTTIRRLQNVITFSYVSGLASLVIGNVQMLAQLPFSPDLMRGEAVSLVGLFYSFLLSEFFLRPTIKRIEWIQSNDGGKIPRSSPVL